jgi:uncharacterized protein (TIGR03118 family)
MQPIRQRFALMACALLIAAGSARAGEVYFQTNLVSNGAVPAQVTDANLMDPWGLSFSKTSPFWISDQASSVLFNGSPTQVSTLYNVNLNTPPSAVLGSAPGPAGRLQAFGVTNQGNAPPSTNETNGPTGQVNTSAPGITTSPTTDFQFTAGGTTGRAVFIFANLDGSISAWKPGLQQTVIQQTVAGASFTGLAIGNLPGPGGAPQLYAADQNSGKVDVLNNKWQTMGSFTDPKFATFPTGYATFNVQNLSVNGTQTLFVTFANQSTTGGIVDEFKTDGTFIKTLVSDTAGAHLAAPWGMAIAPAGWGKFGGDLLVGNNNANSAGLTEINA